MLIYFILINNLKFNYVSVICSQKSSLVLTVYPRDYERRKNKVARTGFELPTLSLVDRDLGYKKCSTACFDHSMAST